MESGAVQAAGAGESADAGTQAQLADLLTSHRTELQRYLQQWSLQQDRLIKRVLQTSPPPPSEVQTSTVLQPAKAQALARASGISLADSSGSTHRSAICHSSSETGGSPANVTTPSENFRRSAQQPVMSGTGTLASSWITEHEMELQPSRALVFKSKIVEEWQWRKQACIPRMVNSTAFELISTVVIITNAVVMAYSVDYAMHNLDDPRNPTVEQLEVAMTVYYIFELICRLAAERLYFFVCDHYKWNLFDLILVLLSLYEVIGDLLSPQGTGGNLSFVRLVRIAKMLKMLRVVRILRSFRELRLIMTSMLGSMKTMLWSLLLIAVISFIVALAFMQNIATYATDNRLTMPLEMQQGIDTYWKSIYTAMTSLYMASTGGDSWSYVAQPLKTVGEPLFVAFMIYIAFFLFVVVNTLTSIFIEATFDNAEQDHKQMIREEMRKKNEYISLIKKLFRSIDVTGTGAITRDDFMVNLQNPQMLAFLTRIGIDAIDAAHFFDILADEKNETVDIEKFVLGCMKLRGSARSMDLLGLIHAHDRNSSRLRKSMAQCETALSIIQQHLAQLRADVSRHSFESSHGLQSEPGKVAEANGELVVPI